jgi:hypothetical protein
VKKIRNSATTSNLFSLIRQQKNLLHRLHLEKMTNNHSTWFAKHNYEIKFVGGGGDARQTLPGEFMSSFLRSDRETLQLKPGHGPFRQPAFRVLAAEGRPDHHQDVSLANAVHQEEDVDVDEHLVGDVVPVDADGQRGGDVRLLQVDVVPGVDFIKPFRPKFVEIKVCNYDLQWLQNARHLSTIVKYVKLCVLLWVEKSTQFENEIFLKMFFCRNGVL